MSAPSLNELRAKLDVDRAGELMHAFASELFPICRSITGAGVRETLRRISDRISLDVHEVPTGTPVLDWVVPQEWNIDAAWVNDPSGKRVVDLRENNLHVVSYSEPVHAHMTRAELARHVFTLPDRPQYVPYRTSYYERSWGICMTHEQFEGLPEGDYEVCIDARLDDGALTYGEVVIEGDGPEEVLLSCHVCHPSLANDNLSGIALATFASEALRGLALRHSYRFVFIPGTIGSISWLAANERNLSRITAGLVLSGVGDRGPFTYKRSRRGDTTIDRAVEHVLRMAQQPFDVFDFSPYGYDERQYCSPGFDLPVGRLSRSPHGEYPEYHTSADDLAFITPAALGDALSTLLAVIDVLEHDRRYQNLNPKGEPQLGRRGLYRAVGGAVDRRSAEMALLWVLNLSDGEHSLLDIAASAALPFDVVRDAASTLEEHELLAPVAGA
ncbi:MAG: peptidase [Actinomycetia bacterium]|nr:peptidase [Actinomycetes bacterium]